MKPNSTFKLSKTTKRMLCSIVNTEQRNSWKKSMIQAELYSKVVVKPTRDKNERGGKSNYVANDTGTASTSVE
jgi:hypothetical protein